MTYEELLQQIKSKGHWKILFEPIELGKIEPLSECKELVVKSSVELRGWDYPHIPKRIDENTAVEPGDNFWQGWINWPEYAHYEFWRMYQSEQFIHYRSIHLDWQKDVVFENMWKKQGIKISPGEVLGVLDTIFLITEVFQFLSRLTSENAYKKGVMITITLNKTKNRKLIVDTYARLPFHSARKTIAEKIEFKKTLSKQEAISNAKEVALEALLYIFERFNWQPNPDMIIKDQEKLLSRKL